MVFPLYDDNSDRTTTPIVNYVLIAINILVFVFLQQLGNNDKFTYAFSTVPEEIVTGRDIRTDDRVREDAITGERLLVPGLQKTPGSVYLTLIFSMFMHGGIAHIGGNMLFLWIFGDNVEDRMGHIRYLIFYLVCGVLGGYIVLYPHRRVTAIVFRFLTDVPAYVAIGIWFAFQLISGLGMFGGGSQSGGVAYAAHIGGFIAGLVLIKFFDTGNRDRSAPAY